jgi:hypothetical protein
MWNESKGVQLRSLRTVLAWPDQKQSLGLHAEPTYLRFFQYIPSTNTQAAFALPMVGKTDLS